MPSTFIVIIMNITDEFCGRAVHERIPKNSYIIQLLILSYLRLKDIIDTPTSSDCSDSTYEAAKKITRVEHEAEQETGKEKFQYLKVNANLK